MVTAVPDQTLRILHLEDSPADHELAMLSLRRANLPCHLHRIDSLSEFTTLIGTGTFDLILADYRLPGFTALDAWHQLSALSSPPPFVLLSGAIGETAAVDAMRLGISDYLLKDDIGRLAHVIRRAIEVHEARRAREEATRELAASQKSLARLTDHLQTSIEQERASIAREIHDDIGGALTAVRFDVAWVQRHSADPDLREHANAAMEMLQHAIEASQRIMMNLRPPILEQGLVAAVQWLADSFERRTGIPAQVTSDKDQFDLPADVQLAAYRTAQEALTNASKHALPTKVAIDLSDREGVLTLEVTDNGRGMAAASRDKPRAFGLRGLQERAHTVGGWLDISSRPGAGTSVILSVPLPTQAVHAGEAD